MAPNHGSDYRLLDSGSGQKWEQFGKISLVRPCPQAIWRPSLSVSQWTADAFFTHQQRWMTKRPLPESWQVCIEQITFLLKLTDFGHLGLFPEQAPFWRRLAQMSVAKVLNLFAYSGGSSMAAARAGAEVTHVDAAAGMVSWAKLNAKINGLNIRWMVDDVGKYLKRAVKRGERYDGIILDPPTFGRGAAGEVFKIEEHLPHVLEQCRLLWRGGYILLTCHTPGYTSLVLEQLVRQIFPQNAIETGDMFLDGPLRIPSGTYVYIS